MFHRWHKKLNLLRVFKVNLRKILFQSMLTLNLHLKWISLLGFFYFNLFICPPDVKRPKLFKGFYPLNLHKYRNIYLHRLLCTQSNYLYYNERINLWYRNFVSKSRSTMSSFFKTSLPELTYLWIRLNKTKPFLGNKNNTDANGVNEHNRNWERQY